MSRRRRDRAEWLLDLATSGLPPRWTEWGAAMRAELAALDVPRARWRFARSASAAAITHGLGLPVGGAAGVAVAVAALVLAASRVQLPAGGPGVLLVSVPSASVPLLVATIVTVRVAGSVRWAVVSGALSMVAGLAAVFAVLAIEGPVWMERHGVFMLDGDPPQQVVGVSEVVLDLFTTGMWIPHLVFWAPWVALGAALGTLVAPRSGVVAAE